MVECIHAAEHISHFDAIREFPKGTTPQNASKFLHANPKLRCPCRADAAVRILYRKSCLNDWLVSPKCMYPGCDRETLRNMNGGLALKCDIHQVGRARIGDVRYSPDGYRSIKTQSGWQVEHRVIMAEHLGRELSPEENVHHINGDRADNRLVNLELWASPQPSGQRSADLIAFVVRQYEDEVQQFLRTGQLPLLAFGAPTVPTSACNCSPRRHEGQRENENDYAPTQTTAALTGAVTTSEEIAS